LSILKKWSDTARSKHDRKVHHSNVGIDISCKAMKDDESYDEQDHGRHEEGKAPSETVITV